MYEVYSKQARERAGLEVVSFAPIVTAENLDAYNIYTRENIGWVENSRTLGGQVDPTLEGLPYEPISQISDVHSPRAALSAGPYAPLWMQSPPPLNGFVLSLNLGDLPPYSKAFQALNTVRGT